MLHETHRHGVSVCSRNRTDDMGILRTGERRKGRTGKPLYKHCCRCIFLSCRRRLLQRNDSERCRVHTISAYNSISLHQRALHEDGERDKRLGLHHARTDVHRPALLYHQRARIQCHSRRQCCLQLHDTALRVHIPLGQRHRRLLQRLTLRQA